VKLHLLLLLSFAACEKTSNVGPLQDEATGLTNHYKVRFDDLQKRVSLLEAKGRSMVSIGQPQGMVEVRKLFLDTTKRLNELKSAVTQASGQINLALKGDHPRTELIKLTSELRERFEHGETEVTAGLDQVEGWLSYVEYRPKLEPVAPPVDDKRPDGAGGGNDGAGAGGGTDAKPADAKPADAKPADAKPDDKKPDAKKDPSGSGAIDKKPADAKPNAKKDDKKPDAKKDDKKPDAKKDPSGSGSAVKMDAKPETKPATGSNK
jgi:hypothetical protein